MQHMHSVIWQLLQYQSACILYTLYEQDGLPIWVCVVSVSRDFVRKWLPAQDSKAKREGDGYELHTKDRS